MNHMDPSARLIRLATTRILSLVCRPLRRRYVGDIVECRIIDLIEAVVQNDKAAALVPYKLSRDSYAAERIISGAHLRSLLLDFSDSCHCFFPCALVGVSRSENWA